MTVKELMEKLEQFPADAPVIAINNAQSIFDVACGDELEGAVCAMTENLDREMEQMVFLKY